MDLEYLKILQKVKQKNNDPIFIVQYLPVLKTREEPVHNTAEYATTEDHHGRSVFKEMIDNTAYAQHLFGHSTP